MTLANLALRFVLELAGVAAVAYWGYGATDSPLRLLLAAGAVLALVAVWAVVVAPKATNGLSQEARMIAGTALLVAAAGALAVAGQPVAGLGFAVIVILNAVLAFVLPGGAGAARAMGTGRI